MVTLPPNKKVERKPVPDQIKVFVYGAPFMGKTLFADTFPDALILSTDGNTSECESPSILICDQVVKEGRIVKTTLAWNYFKEVLDQLEKHEEGYKTIVLDLLDDLYDMCRVAKCKELGIKHESDNNTKAWDIVRSEFRNQMRRLTSMGYHIVWISHEIEKSDFMSRGGDNTVAINPSIHQVVYQKMSGMVGLCVRAVREKGEYKLKLKQDGVMLIGTRFGRGVNLPDEIPATYEAVETLYKTKRSE